LFGIGLDTYWNQFDGLRERLTGYQRRIAASLRRAGANVVDAGLVDSPEAARAAAAQLRQEPVEVVLLYVSTYALSSTVLPVAQQVGAPIVVLNLQPVAQLDYAAFNALGDRGRMTGIWLEHCQACACPELACVFRRAGIPFRMLTGVLGEPAVERELGEWVQAARLRRALRETRVGVLGHYYGGMLDIYSDLTQQCAYFGGHVEMVEVDELSSHRREVSGGQISERVAAFRQVFDVQADCPQAELERAARTSVALDRLVSEKRLGSLAYYYMGTGNPENEDAISSIILGTSLLTARGTPVAGELEIKNAQAMKIMDSFGAGGSFTEYYALDYNDDVVLMGHDGPGHIAIAEGKTKVRPLEV